MNLHSAANLKNFSEVIIGCLCVLDLDGRQDVRDRLQWASVTATLRQIHAATVTGALGPQRSKGQLVAPARPNSRG